MRLVIYDGVRYLLSSYTDEAMGEFHRQLPMIRADIQGMKDSQSGEQKWFHRQDSWNIKEAFGTTTVEVFSKSGEPKPVEKRERIDVITSVVIGLEYTDGTYSGFEGPLNEWPLYSGSGVCIGEIAGGEFIPEINIPWGEEAILHGPWTMDETVEDGDDVDRFFFSSYMASTGEKYITLGETKFEQLDEVEYNPDVKIKLVRTVDRVFPDNPYDPDYNIWEYIDTTITTIKINDEILVGPLTWTHHYRHEYRISTHMGQLVDDYLGEKILTLAGVAVSENQFLCLYCKQVGTTYGVNSGIISGPLATFDNPTQYTGSVMYEGHALYKDPDEISVDIISNSRNFTVVDLTYPYYPRCTRIFKVSDTSFIYLYSFINPTVHNIDTDAFLEEPNCHYGCVIYGNNSNTDIGYSMLLEDDWYNNANIVDGLPVTPVQLYSSILMRAFLKTRTITREEF